MSSASFPSLELHCRPSAWLRAAVLALVALAAVSVMLSGLAAWWLAIVPALGVLAWRGSGAYAGLVLRFGGDGSLLLDDGPAEPRRCAELLGVEERGPLLVVAVRIAESPVVANGGSYNSHAASTPGRNCRSRRWRRTTLHVCFGPDTAPDAARRALRLWQQRHAGTDDGVLAALGLH